MRTGLIAACLCLASVAGAVDTMHFDLPADTKVEDAEKAATALARRCADYGYKKVTGTREEIKGKQVVSLTCESGWTNAMRQNVEFWASILGQKLELYRERRLSDVEREQFESPHGSSEEITKAPAPEGKKWVPKCEKSGSNAAILVDAKPVIASPKLDLFVAEDEGRSWWFPVSADQAKMFGTELVRGKANYVGKVGWVVDGQVMFTTDCKCHDQTSEKVTYGMVLDDAQKKLLALVCKNPLPFRMTLRQEEEK